MSKQLAYRDRVAAYFKDRPNTWIDGDDFRPVGGKYAYRSRISDCRTELGMTIENRQRREHQFECAVWLPMPGFGEPYDCTCQPFVISEYRYVPESAPVQPSKGHDVNAWSLS